MGQNPINGVDPTGLRPPTLTLNASTEHTWLTLDYGNGKVLTRGLFPSGFDDSRSGNEGKNASWESYTKELTEGQVSSLEDFWLKGSFGFGFRDYNCTDFAMDSWEAAGQKLPGKHGRDPWLIRPHLNNAQTWFGAGMTLLPRFGMDVPLDLQAAIQNQRQADAAAAQANSYQRTMDDLRRIREMGPR